MATMQIRGVRDRHRRARTGRGPDRRLCAHVGRELGPVARPRKVIVVAELPKTRSGKIMRRLMLATGFRTR